MGLSNLKNLASLAQAAKTPVSGTRVLALSLEEVKPNPDQVRKTFNGIRELADSLLQEGQIQPIIVSPKDEDGIYVIQKGERRWRACQEAGLPTIDAIVNEKDLTDLDTTAGELVENIQRDDLTPMEIAAGLQLFVEQGWKQKDIAKRIGKTVPFVSSHLSLLKLPETVMSLYDEGITRDPETLNNLRILHDLNPDQCGQLCSTAQTAGISRIQSREVLNTAKETAKAGKISKQTNEPPPASDPENKNTDTSGNTEWRVAKPSQLQFAVSADVDGKIVTGLLITDRVDHDPSHVWIRLDGKQEIRIPAKQLKLEEVTTK